MTEDQLEQETLAWLADVGYQHRHGPELAPERSTPRKYKYPTDKQDAAVEQVLEQAKALADAWA